MKVKVARALKKRFRKGESSEYQRKRSLPEPVDSIGERLTRLPEKKVNDGVY